STHEAAQDPPGAQRTQSELIPTLKASTDSTDYADRADRCNLCNLWFKILVGDIDDRTQRNVLPLGRDAEGNGFGDAGPPAHNCRSHDARARLSQERRDCPAA